MAKKDDVVAQASGLPTTEVIYAISMDNRRGLLPPPSGSRMTIFVQTAVLEAVERGHTLKTAAALGGVTAESVRRWVTKGDREDGGTPYGLFAVEFHRAEGRAQELLLERILDTGRNDWRSYAWVLQRRYEAWSDKPKPDVLARKLEYELRLEKARAEIDLIKARTQKLLQGSDVDPLKDLLVVLGEEDHGEEP